MRKYVVETDFQGYCRGTRKYLVEANSEEEAKDKYGSFGVIEEIIVRDDTEEEVDNVYTYKGY